MFESTNIGSRTDRFILPTFSRKPPFSMSSKPWKTSDSAFDLPTVSSGWMPDSLLESLCFERFDSKTDAKKKIKKAINARDNVSEPGVGIKLHSESYLARFLYNSFHPHRVKFPTTCCFNRSPQRCPRQKTRVQSPRLVQRI